MYYKYYEWSFAIGKKVLEPEKGEDLLKRLIFSIRAEETPGRFLDRLSKTLGEYKTNRNIDLDVTMLPDLYGQLWFADKFYYLKSSILSGLLGAMPNKGYNKNKKNMKTEDKQEQ